MIEITKITELDDKRHIALLDTTSISFMQGLSVKGLQPEVILKDSGRSFNYIGYRISG